MRTIDEFNAAADAHMRRLMIFFSAGTAGLLACWITGGVIRETARQTFSNCLERLATKPSTWC